MHWLLSLLVPIRKWLFCPISAPGSNFNPRNITYIPVGKIFAFLELEQNISFLNGHYLNFLLWQPAPLG